MWEVKDERKEELMAGALDMFCNLRDPEMTRNAEFSAHTLEEKV